MQIELKRKSGLAKGLIHEMFLDKKSAGELRTDKEQFVNLAELLFKGKFKIVSDEVEYDIDPEELK